LRLCLNGDFAGQYQFLSLLLLEFREGPEAQIKYLDRDTLERGAKKAYEGTH